MSEGKALVDPRLAEAVRLYTDPLLPTFGNKLAACVQAGYASGQALDGVAAKAEVGRIQQQRVQASKKISDYLGTYAFDAARELINQLGEGSALEVVDVTNLLRDPTEGEILRALELAAGHDVPGVVLLNALREDKLARADQISKHNRQALAAAKQRLLAVELLLRYHMGEPGQGGSGKQSRLPDELDLGKLSNTELQKLGDVIYDVLEKKKGAAPPKKDDAPVPTMDGDFEVES